MNAASISLEAIREVIDAFIDEVVADRMIGFYFANVDVERLKAREVEHAAAHLGLPVHYAGRSLTSAHRPRRIPRGHFGRRLVILEACLRRFDVSPRVRDRWLAAQHAAAADVIFDPDKACPESAP